MCWQRSCNTRKSSVKQRYIKTKVEVSYAGRSVIVVSILFYVKTVVANLCVATRKPSCYKSLSETVDFRRMNTFYIPIK